MDTLPHEQSDLEGDLLVADVLEACEDYVELVT